MNKILFKIFGTMSTDSFCYVWECFGIDPLEQLIQERQDKFNKKYSARDNLLCSALSGIDHLKHM